VKRITIIGLVFCFYVFLGFAFAAQCQAEEYYTYKDPNGTLVISNKMPPSGSIVLKRHELPDTPDAQTQAQQSQEGGDTQLNENAERSAKPSKDK
jgi:Domain of unknown function (DUF4124)